MKFLFVSLESENQTTPFLFQKNNLGLILQTKNTYNFQEIWPNFLFSENSYRFSNCVPIQYFTQFFRESVQLAAPQNLKKFSSVFPRKKCWFKIFWFFLKCISFPQNLQSLEFMCIGLSPGFFFGNLG